MADRPAGTDPITLRDATEVCAAITGAFGYGWKAEALRYLAWWVDRQRPARPDDRDALREALDRAAVEFRRIIDQTEPGTSVRSRIERIKRIAERGDREARALLGDAETPAAGEAPERGDGEGRP